MKQGVPVQVVELERAEMGELMGGELGDGGESLAKDLGKYIGAVLGGAWYLLTNPPASNYTYCKVG